MGRPVETETPDTPETPETTVVPRGPHRTSAASAACPAARTVARYTGEASYYSDALAGNRTASGQVYDPRQLTAAHRNLPFGTWVRVTRQPAGPTVVVQITDRGPFGKRTRIIDLSRAAATKLDMIRAGVVPVLVEVLDCAPQ